MEQINYVPYLPKEPPEGLVGWLLSKGAFKKEFLIYKADREYEPLTETNVPVVRVSCTACERQFTATKVHAGGCRSGYAPAPFGWWNELTGEQVISGSNTMCPICGAAAETVHVGNYGKGNSLTQETWTAVVSRLEVPGKTPRLLLTDWLTQRFVTKEGASRFRNHLYSAWVVEEKKIVRIMGYQKMFSSVSLCEPRQRKTFLDCFGKSGTLWPFDSSVLEGTTAENCKLDLFREIGGEYLVSYLGLWLKHPQVENLIVQGAGKLVNELICQDAYTSSYQRSPGYATCKSINWKEKKPNRMLGLSKEQFRTFVDSEWGEKEYKMLRWAAENEIEVPWPRGVMQLTACGSYHAEEIVKDGHQAWFWKILRYLEKQRRNYGTLRDYWNLADKLGMDLSDGLVRWPRDLKKAHDAASDRYNQCVNLEMDTEIRKRAEALAFLCWEKDGLLIRPCGSKTELQTEGRELHHCVATYDKRYAEGRTAIFLIRRTEKPDEPYYTLELDEKNLTVRQNRGLRNCARTPEVQAFEDKWLAWVKAGAKKKKKEVNAA